MKLLTIAFLATLSVSAFSKDYVTSETIDLLKSNDQLSLIRVYASKSVQSIYKATTLDVTKTQNGDLTRQMDQDILIKEVPTTVKGKIIEIEPFKLKIWASEESTWGAKKIWVSFDSKCKSKSCSYVFEYNEKKGKYRLEKVPYLKGYAHEETNIGDFYESNNVWLEFNMSELLNVKKTKEVANGFE